MATDSFQSFAYDKIREDIVYCNLVPGEKISAKRMEEELDIGRTPVREALVRLGQQGLVYTVPQSGTYVSLIQIREAENARYVREHLEKSVVVECCARANSDECASLASIIAEQEQAVVERDSLSFFQLDNRFHEELFRIAGRHDIWRWISSTNTDLERFRWLRTQVAELDWNTIMSQHHQLLEAVRSHNPEEGRFLASTHLHLMIAEKDAVIAAFPEYFAA